MGKKTWNNRVLMKKIYFWLTTNILFNIFLYTIFFASNHNDIGFNYLSRLIIIFGMCFSFSTLKKIKFYMCQSISSSGKIDDIFTFTIPMYLSIFPYFFTAMWYYFVIPLFYIVLPLVVIFLALFQNGLNEFENLIAISFDGFSNYDKISPTNQFYYIFYCMLLGAIVIYTNKRIHFWYKKTKYPFS